MISKIFKPFLWSYKWGSVDKEKNKKRIILNVLNFGSLQAVRELFRTYSKNEILTVFRNAKKTEFSRKNWNFWNTELTK